MMCLYIFWKHFVQIWIESHLDSKVKNVNVRVCMKHVANYFAIFLERSG